MPVDPSRPPETRSYSSAKRDAAAAEKRQAVIDAASLLLNEGPAMLSMEGVAKAAGVTRLTVYKQFGSRRGLLEAVFDANADRGGIHRIREAMSLPDPRQAMFACIDMLCEFWGNHPEFSKLHDMAVVDSEFAEALNLRNERRRLVFMNVVGRMSGDQKTKADTIDLLFGVTGMPVFRGLLIGRTPAEVAHLMKTTCGAILDAQGIS